ncbi:MAG: lipopolysaccharide assembly LapA domain-containing protein [Candidatus Neomarinimicrobiota bacterium]|nr:MAG: LapA family protein [bacterium]|tara:strand:- start:398 stop:715 length:318 start_codon:yes stop_codon:yes gene_type:complete
MKLVKIFAALVLVIIILYFLLQNNNPVNVDLVFYQKENVPISVVMLGALGVGMLIGYVVALMLILAGKSEIRSLKNKNQQLAEELNELRNANIDEGIYEDEDGAV